MNGFVLFLIVVGSIVGFYVFFFIVNLIFVYIFLKRLRVHNNALTILLNQKYDNLKELYSILLKNNINLSTLDEKLYESFLNLDIESFKKIELEDCIINRQILSNFKQDLLLIIKRNEELLKNEQIILLINILNEIDEQFRAISASYNADVIGYNYWIRFKPYMYIFLFNRVDKKDTI